MNIKRLKYHWLYEDIFIWLISYAWAIMSRMYMPFVNKHVESWLAIFIFILPIPFMCAIKYARAYNRSHRLIRARRKIVLTRNRLASLAFLTSAFAYVEVTLGCDFIIGQLNWAGNYAKGTSIIFTELMLVPIMIDVLFIGFVNKRINI